MSNTVYLNSNIIFIFFTVRVTAVQIVTYAFVRTLCLLGKVESASETTTPCAGKIRKRGADCLNKPFAPVVYLLLFIYLFVIIPRNTATAA